MKILHILDHSLPLQSGYTFRTRSIIENQRRLGWLTEHITSSKHRLVNGLVEEIEGLRFFRTPQPTSWYSNLPIGCHAAVVTTLRRRLFEVAKDVKPDILHAHSPALNGLAAISVSRQLRLPLVYEVRAFWEDAAVDHGTTTEGNLRYRASRVLETRVLRHANAIVTICDGLRSDLLGRGLPRDKVVVVPNAVDATLLNASSVRDKSLAAKLGLSGKRVLGFVGSFYAYEGLTLLVKAVSTVLTKVPDAHVLLVGGGPDESRILQEIAQRGLARHVTLTGRVPHDEVQRYYDLIEVLVYPRLPMRLTELVTPLKPLEAMARGRPVVASDVGGHKELIRDGSTGRLFRAGDATALAHTLIDVLSNPEQTQGISATGRKFVEDERTWADSVTRYKSVYARALERGAFP